MRKNVFGRRFKRDRNERQALFKGLIRALILHERIETTAEKAKAIKSQVEKMVTKAKKGNINGNAQHFLSPTLSGSALQKMISDIAVRFKERPGGYTRIVKLGKRFNDDATKVFMEWVEKSSESKIQNSELDKKKDKKTQGKKGETNIIDAEIITEEPKKTDKKAFAKQKAKVDKVESAKETVKTEGTKKTKKGKNK